MNSDVFNRFTAFSALPVCNMLPEICRSVREKQGCIIHAAPGAGKTMLVPVALKSVFSGKILLLEPRRIAAKNAAAGIAFMQKWTLGKEVGFKVRGESCTASDTGIISVTCGVALNMIQQDPELKGFDCIIFDEFHERSAEQELFFALLDEVRSALRDDLSVVIMSATLDGDVAAKLPHLPEIRVPGREYPVELSYREIDHNPYFLPRESARAVMNVYNTSSAGDILLFLPGKNEIDRCFELLDGSLENCCVMKLHGGLPLSEQSRVLKKLDDGRRKVVLATNIAESSLTIDGITAVIDSGYERRMRFAPGMGMPVLELCRIPVDSAVQRAGRAGRTAPGTALRLWSRQEEMGFLRTLAPEITRCDLARTVLEIARWGSRPEQLNWLTPPPEAGISAAVKTVQSLGLLDENMMLTPAGVKAASLPLHPRLGAMLDYASRHHVLPLAILIAAIIEEGNFARSGKIESCDIREKILVFRKNPERFPAIRQSLNRLQELFHAPAFDGDDSAAGKLIAVAYPEYVGRSRRVHSNIYQLSGGRTAFINEDDALRKEEFLAIAALSIIPGKEAAVQLAAPLSEAELNELFEDKFVSSCELEFDAASGKVAGMKMKKFGSLVISAAPFVPEGTQVGMAVLTAALKRRIEIIAPESAAGRLLARVRFARSSGDETFPDWSEENFIRILPDLAEAFVGKVKDFNSLNNLNWYDILKSALDYNQLETLNRLFPDKYRTPAGQEIAIDYSGEQPTLQVPIQQLYGEKIHPSVGRNRLALRLELLSPARRPVQITCDLPGFWQGSWSLVRSEMRSRYPKHEWPEHPENADPRRSSVKKRG